MRYNTRTQHEFTDCYFNVIEAARLLTAWSTRGRWRPRHGAR